MPSALIDLHTHSQFSDGSDTPTELIAHAKAARVDILALTDHDTLAGIDEASRALEGTGMVLVPGIELSAQVIDDYPGAIPRSVHVLGYLVDPANDALRLEMERIRSHRDDRLRLMVEALQRDFSISWEQVSSGIAPGATPGRPHIAKALIEAGYFSDTDAAFAGPLRADGPYHVPHYAPRLHTALSLIRDAGGVAVLAHPFTSARSGAVDHTRGRDDVLADYERFVGCGLAGLEINHRENTPEGKELLADIAREFSLIVTGSSDYHGDRKANRLGENSTSQADYEAIVAQASGAAPIS